MRPKGYGSMKGHPVTRALLEAMDDDWVWPEFPVVLGSGAAHDLRDAEDRTTKSRLWDLKSTSKAACVAYDKQQREPKSRKVGFLARRPR